jgi:phosphopentomutase
MSRAFILLLDSFGLGAAPDADKFGDVGANTFGHIAEWAAKKASRCRCRTWKNWAWRRRPQAASGEWAAGFEQRDGFTGAYGAAREQSTGKDTPERPLGNRRRAGEFDWGYFPRTCRRSRKS